MWGFMLLEKNVETHRFYLLSVPYTRQCSRKEHHLYSFGLETFLLRANFCLTYKCVGHFFYPNFIAFLDRVFNDMNICHKMDPLWYVILCHRLDFLNSTWESFHFLKLLTQEHIKHYFLNMAGQMSACHNSFNRESNELPNLQAASWSLDLQWCITEGSILWQIFMLLNTLSKIAIILLGWKKCPAPSNNCEW